MPTTSSTNELVKLPSLENKLRDGSTYPEWAEEIMTYLEIYGWDTVVKGTLIEPDSTGKPEDNKEWNQINKKARAFIMLNTEGTAKSLIIMEKSAHKAWDLLKDQYRSTTRTNLQSLTDSLFRLTFDNRMTTIDEHINEFQARWNRLAAAVSTVSEHDQKALTPAAVLHTMTRSDSFKAQRLLGSLSEYHRLIVNNIATQSESLSYSAVASQLRELVTSSSRPRRGNRLQEEEDYSQPTAFGARASEKICNYCRSKKGWSGKRHIESECRTKAREQLKLASVNSVDHNIDNSTEYAFMTTNTPTKSSSTWVYDTGASVHITPYRDILINPQPDNTPVLTVSDCQEHSTLKGDVLIRQGKKFLRLEDVLYIEHAPENLLSGQLMRRNNLHFRTDDGNPRLTLNGETVINVTEYQGKPLIVGDDPQVFSASVDPLHYHLRYGHLPLTAFRHIEESPKGLHALQVGCEACAQGKSRKAASSNHQSSHRRTRILKLLHSDICGPINPRGINGARYFITLIDDFSRYTMVATLAHKHEAGTKVLEMINLLETRIASKVQALQTDNAGEYRSKALLTELARRGIQVKETIAHHSETNPVAERCNQTIHMMARTALLHSKLPKSLWPEAISHSMFTKNRIPHATLSGRSPIELLLPNTNIQEERSRFRYFGEPVWVHIPQEKSKLQPRSIKVNLVGYGSGFQTFWVYTENRAIVLTKNPKGHSVVTQIAVPEICRSSKVQGSEKAITDSPPQSPGMQLQRETTVCSNAMQIRRHLNHWIIWRKQ